MATFGLRYFAQLRSLHIRQAVSLYNDSGPPAFCSSSSWRTSPAIAILASATTHPPPSALSRWGVKCEAFIGKSNLSIAARVRTSGIYLRATFAGNVSHRLHIGFEDSSKSEGVVTRHCHFAESLGIAVNNCYICGNSKREYDYLSQYKRRFC